MKAVAEKCGIGQKDLKMIFGGGFVEPNRLLSSQNIVVSTYYISKLHSFLEIKYKQYRHLGQLF